MPSKNKKILVVEDEYIVAIELCMKLQREGYIVIPYASSGREALDKAAEYEPDLILMDIFLEGEIDGVTAGRIMRGRTKAPILFTTALECENINKNIAGLSDAKCLQKPFEFSELLQVIRGILGD